MSIIGLSGRIGSGKNTVGVMIQYLLGYCCDKNGDNYEHEIYLDTLANPEKLYQYINNYNRWESKLEFNSGYERKYFAHNLKKMVELFTGIPVYYQDDQDVKKSNLPNIWDDDNNQPMSLRNLLIKSGNALRDVHPNYHVNGLFSKYDPDKNKYLVTDTRYLNEAKAIVDRGGIVIRVERYYEIKEFLQFYDIDFLYGMEGLVDNGIKYTIPDMMILLNVVDDESVNLSEVESRKLISAYEILYNISENDLENSQFITYTLNNSDNLLNLFSEVKQMLLDLNIIRNGK